MVVIFIKTLDSDFGIFRSVVFYTSYDVLVANVLDIIFFVYEYPLIVSESKGKCKAAVGSKSLY